MAATDILAETVAATAQAMGLNVPHDLSVAGFDDVTIDPAKPAWLTIYAQPKRRIGQQTARLLMKRLQNLTRGTVTVLLEGQLVERGSTRIAPGAGEEPFDRGVELRSDRPMDLHGNALTLGGRPLL